MPLSGQTAVITGASSGIGTAIAENLSQAGMNLVLTARRENRLQESLSKLGPAAILAGDITDPRLPQRLVDLAVERFGRCDALINNAGILEIGPIDSIDLDRVCSMVRINVEAAFRMAYVAARHFLQQKRGHLVNVSSILGTKTRPTAGAYAGTKYAIEALSESLRLELAGTGIRVTAIQPGLVMTELHSNMEVHPAQAWGMKHPLQPPDIARAVRYALEQPDHVCVARLMVLPEENPI